MTSTMIGATLARSHSYLSLSLPLFTASSLRFFFFFCRFIAYSAWRFRSILSRRNCNGGRLPNKRSQCIKLPLLFRLFRFFFFFIRLTRFGQTVRYSSAVVTLRNTPSRFRFALSARMFYISLLPLATLAFLRKRALESIRSILRVLSYLLNPDGKKKISRHLDVYILGQIEEAIKKGKPHSLLNTIR